jgi:hypothetical protein
MENQPTTPEKGSNVVGYLVTALQMEDHISRDVYGVYLERSTWPTTLSAEAFTEVQRLLTILIEETDRHRRAFRSLQQRYGNAKS